MPKVAVEKSLSHVSTMLRRNGFDVVELGNWQQMVDAVVITGLDQNMTGNQSKSIAGAPVISADGLTLDEIFHMVNERCSPVDEIETR
ncbi:YkuS family protein [Brevibacillus daliensis]|uniref:YkuS family protein n=1 Tax=Brevibacillus daliensis TaxID=2892995 RepID=UPI001E4D1A18|nr:YkuS family protein [Brevibacillus daliensis]